MLIKHIVHQTKHHKIDKKMNVNFYKFHQNDRSLYHINFDQYCTVNTQIGSMHVIIEFGRSHAVLYLRCVQK